MIYGLVGNVGSGKTISLVRTIHSKGQSEVIHVDDDRDFSWIPLHLDTRFYCNFAVKSKNAIRLKKEDIIMKTLDDKGKHPKYQVNWEFWKDAQSKGNFCICLDEVSGLFHSRRAMTSWNIAGTDFIQQIRKITHGSKYHHIVLVTQKLERLDIAWRDLLHGIVSCEMRGDMIIRHHFHGIKNKDIHSAFNMHEMGEKTYDFRDCFYAPDYFKYYDTYEVIGDSPYL